MSDLIEREEAIKAVWKPKVNPNDLIFDALKTAIESKINDIPSAERKGRNLLAEYPSLFECSECGTSCHDTIPWDCNINYCPNCGAKMKGVEDEN